MKSNLIEELRSAVDVPSEVERGLEHARPRLGVIGHRVYWLLTVGSTNDVASNLAERGAAEGTLVVAEAQSAGRGRHGRAWFSPPGAGLYASLVLRPAGPQVSPLLSLASGVAIAEGVRAVTGLPATIKWPNDVTVGGRKLAGILAESAAEADGSAPVILGFGINLRAASYPLELADRVTSIEAETSRPSDSAVLLVEVLAAFAARYAELRAGRFDAILTSWRQLACLPRAVEWTSPAGAVRGCAEDIDDTGALIVRVDGRLERVIAGDVRLI